ncbi:MAG: DUF2779 domain-containing protein [Clostridia bacterium]|nr:DUF2779 domain-containing protein [Clostridia bacterium]
MAWLDKYKPEEREEDDSAENRMETGNEVGDLAMGLFGDFVEVTTKKDDGSLNKQRMIERTAEEMEKGTSVICEAAFSFNGLYCAADILKRDGNGWAIYEVKSSTDPEKTVYHADVAYQKYVLEHCGVCVTKTYLVTLNNQYVFDGTLDIEGLFNITDVSDLVEDQKSFVGPNLEAAEPMLMCADEPDIDLSESCFVPYPCAFWKYCTRALPAKSVFDLYWFGPGKSLPLYHEGVISYEDLEKSGIDLSDTNKRIIDFALHDRGIYVDKENLAKYLKSYTYPLYFLDFESMQLAVPKYIGTRPYMQICFQYSLHYIEEEGGELKHKEFLAEPEDDPRRALAEGLCRDIPRDVDVVVFNKGFERTRIREMAEAFPDLADHLLNIRDNIVDLLVPFKSGWYYKREIGNSYSIKSVLPALCPDDPALDYHALDQVHHGGEAMTIFPAMVNMSPEERARTRHNLLKYCELDTLAMVKVWEKLKEAVKGD